MTTAFLHRIRKEITVTMTGLHEAVIAISERVNRKVQLLKLHWQASVIDQHIETIHHQIGAHLASLAGPDGALGPCPSHRREELDRRLVEATSRIRVLKSDLAQVESFMRELEGEALRATFQRIQQDLFTRDARLERLVVAHGSAAAGQGCAQLPLAGAKIVAVLRGAMLLAGLESIVFKPGDIVLLLGSHAEVTQAAGLFTQRQKAMA